MRVYSVWISLSGKGRQRTGREERPQVCTLLLMWGSWCEAGTTSAEPQPSSSFVKAFQSRTSRRSEGECTTRELQGNLAVSERTYYSVQGKFKEVGLYSGLNALRTWEGFYGWASQYVIESGETTVRLRLCLVKKTAVPPISQDGGYFGHLYRRLYSCFCLCSNVTKG